MRWQIRSFRTETNSRQVLSRDALFDQVPGEPPHARGKARERVHVAPEADLQRDLAEPEPLQREEIALRHDPDERVRLGNEDMADPMVDHRERRVVGWRMAGKPEWLARHRFGDRPVEARLERDAQEVALGEDPDRTHARVDHHDGADPFRLHHLQRIAHGAALVADHGRAADERAQGAGERPMLARQAALEQVVGLGHRRSSPVNTAAAHGTCRARLRAPARA